MLKTVGKVTLLCFGVLLFIVALILFILLLTGWPFVTSYSLDINPPNDEAIAYYSALGATIFLFALACICVWFVSKRPHKSKEQLPALLSKNIAKPIELEIGSIENGLRNALMGFGTLLLVFGFFMFIVTFKSQIANVLDYGFDEPIFSEVLERILTGILDFFRNIGFGLLCLFAAHKIKPFGDKK